jgi:hypothetical protein
VQLSRFYGASFADMLNVAAAQCTQTLGASVNIASECKRNGLDLEVRGHVASSVRSLLLFTLVPA